jgi:hypothetical protein
MRLRAKLVAVTQQHVATTSAAGMRPGMVLFKFAMNEDRQAVFRRCKGSSGDKVEPRQGPHAHTVGTQVGAMDVAQGGQGGRQACLLARSRTLH